MKNPLVSIIIVNWNGKHHLEYCLPSVEKIKYSRVEVIIVDNNSTDGSQAYIRKKFPKVKLIEEKENRGFAKGNNIGVKNSTGEYVLFLNNDTEVSPSFLGILVKKITGEIKLGIVQPKILLLEKRDTLDSIGSYLTATGFLYHYGFEEKDSKKLEKETYLFSAKGSCILMRKEIFENVGGFDDRFVNYFEETDLCFRVWIAGYKIKYIPEAVIFHKGWGTSTRLGLYTITYHSFKNRINCLIKNLSLKKLLYILPLHVFVCLFVGVVYAFYLKFDNTKGILNALWWNFTQLSETLKIRKEIQTKTRKVSDNEIFPYIYKNQGIKYYIMILYTSIIRSKLLSKTNEVKPVTSSNLFLQYHQDDPDYNKNYKFFDTSYSNFKTHNYFLDNWQISYIKRLFEYLQLSKEDTFLDIGVGGSGWTVIEAVRSGVKKGVGIDIDKTLMIRATKMASETLPKDLQSSCEFLIADAQVLPFGKNTFSKISSIALLEHIEHFGDAVREISRVCRKNGKVYICVPNAYADTPIFLKLLNKYNDRKVGHFHHFNPTLLIKEFQKNGFKVEKIIYHSHSIKIIQLLLTYLFPSLNNENSKIWWYLEKLDKNQSNNRKSMNFSIILKKVA